MKKTLLILLFTSFVTSVFAASSESYLIDTQTNTGFYSGMAVVTFETVKGDKRENFFNILFQIDLAMNKTELSNSSIIKLNADLGASDFMLYINESPFDAFDEEFSEIPKHNASLSPVYPVIYPKSGIEFPQAQIDKTDNAQLKHFGGNYVNLRLIFDDSIARKFFPLDSYMGVPAEKLRKALKTDPMGNRRSWDFTAGYYVDRMLDTAVWDEASYMFWPNKLPTNAPVFSQSEMIELKDEKDDLMGWISFYIFPMKKLHTTNAGPKY